MAAFAIHADNIVLPEKVGAGYIVIEDGRIVSVGEERPDCEIVDYGGAWVGPGLVDTHIHGFAGHDLMDCDPEGLVTASRELAHAGTACWLPTTVTAFPEPTGAACASAAEAIELLGECDEPAARIAGVFLEGPFFAPPKAGAQEVAAMSDPSLKLLDSWQEQARGHIVKSALAPERAGSLAYIRGCVERGVVAAIGHTAAEFEEAYGAVHAGASVFVHTYNAMSALAHREPGAVGAAMATPESYAELICDGVHVHPGAAAALAAAKGWDHIVLITDCLSCGGPVADGVAPHVGDKPVEVRDGAAWLESGNLAGSTLTLARGVHNVVEWGIASCEAALRSASEVPAIAHGLDGEFGFIKPGRAADLVVMDPRMNLVASYIGGVKAEGSTIQERMRDWDGVRLTESEIDWGPAELAPRESPSWFED